MNSGRLGRCIAVRSDGEAARIVFGADMLRAKDTARADIARGMAVEVLKNREMACRASPLYAQNKRRNHFIWHLFFPSLVIFELSSF